jgi:hypothetical protein
MNAKQTLLKVFDGIHASGSEPARTKVRHAPACESLEGRQLLNAAWTPPQGFPGWDGAAGKGAGPAAHVRPFNMKGAARGGHAIDLHGAPKGLGAPSFAGHKFTQPSAQLQTDFQTLQTDQKALQAEIPASLTAAVKADQAVIRQAFSSLTPTQMKALHPGGPQSGTPSSDPTANLAADLTAAGVSSSQATTIVTDLQNLKSALTTTDPTLQAKIAADRAAIVKDGGPSLPAQGMSMPGMF